MKRIFRLDRLRLRGLSGARDEVLLTATAQNLRRLVNVPVPATAIGGAGLSRIGVSMPQLFKKKQLQLAASSARGIEFMQKQVSVKLPQGSQMGTPTLGIEATLRNVG
jgi:hypothetical protein